MPGAFPSWRNESHRGASCDTGRPDSSSLSSLPSFLRIIWKWGFVWRPPPRHRTGNCLSGSGDSGELAPTTLAGRTLERADGTRRGVGLRTTCVAPILSWKDFRPRSRSFVSRGRLDAEAGRTEQFADDISFLQLHFEGYLEYLENRSMYQSYAKYLSRHGRL